MAVLVTEHDEGLEGQLQTFLRFLPSSPVSIPVCDVLYA